MKLLIEIPTWMGDTVMATPAITNLISHFKYPEITLIGSSISTELLKNYNYVNKIIKLDKNFFTIFKTIRDHDNFDVFISFRGSFRSSLLKIFVKSKQKYQFDKKKYDNGHMVTRYNDFINDCIGTYNEPGKLFLKTQLNFKEDKLTKILGINPGASYGEAKRWYPKKFGKVAVDLSKHYDIVILGGPNEKEIADHVEECLINNNVKNYRNLAAKTSISELVAEINNFDLLITGDSGALHIAAAFEIPTVSIFGPTKNEETSQWMNEKNIIIKKNLDCQPCMKRVCPLKHHKCMNLISEKDVLSAVESLN